MTTTRAKVHKWQYTVIWLILCLTGIIVLSILERAGVA